MLNEFKVFGDPEFIFKLTNDVKIKMALDILTHVEGKIIPSKESYNPDPDTIPFSKFPLHSVTPLQAILILTLAGHVDVSVL
ncbi:hypothetical protein DDB_G0283131 [Dictyostelium discoideum AX4]|uniref:Uncharacterized protein n=1 Tax=Dictyostelium discoideum TaxID=44689 RepID=Q54RI0_DICDI|nr:hypothetical protein DDB_G0283131 [Dictyostelium discoideum AX4]EAL65895.1 hypothetical protein DDB_G0283131 [Dictyostelium discoideum AX4]|eukprot:XP_639256.1 hypothetical protein DDB_G0283131 [Dictyostelium discoideum AX4]